MPRLSFLSAASSTPIDLPSSSETRLSEKRPARAGDMRKRRAQKTKRLRSATYNLLGHTGQDLPFQSDDRSPDRSDGTFRPPAGLVSPPAGQAQPITALLYLSTGNSRTAGPSNGSPGLSPGAPLYIAGRTPPPEECALEQPERQRADEGGKSCAGSECRVDSAGKEVPEDPCPAGFGALAMTVIPPPTTAPSTTAALSGSLMSGTSVAR